MVGLYIPKSILELPVSAEDKLILAKVHEFERNNREFYMSNKALGSLIGKSVRTTSIKVSELRRQNLLVITGFDGRKRKLTLSNQLKREILAIQPRKKSPGSIADSATEYKKRSKSNLNHYYN